MRRSRSKSSMAERVKPIRGHTLHTSYEASVQNEMTRLGYTRTMNGAHLRVLKGGVLYWHQEVGDQLARHYSITRRSSALLQRDWALLRKTCGDKHPKDVTYFDLRAIIEEYQENGSKGVTIDQFVHRMRVIFAALRILEIIPINHAPESSLVVKPVPKGEPRPITRTQAQMLMTIADFPYREWFMFGCLAGLRAMEIATICGSWLEESEPTPDGEAIWLLRVLGKGQTEKVIPCHPALRELILSKNTQGRLYAIQPHYLSKMVNAEMRRLGIVTRNNTLKGKNSSRISFHSTRHYFATALLAASNDIALVSKAMRHTDPRVTMVYAGLNPVRANHFVSGLFSDIPLTTLSIPSPSDDTDATSKENS